MRTVRRLTVGLAVLMSLLSASAGRAQTPQGTAFTYQGRLSDGGGPANGTYDLRFILFDASVGGSQTKPGLVGGAADGEDTDGKVPLAVAGVVPIKVTDEGGPIMPGDALTSSSTPGHAMKAAKVRVGGIAFFPSGVVVGKALDPLNGTTGVIRALVVLQ